MTDTKWRLRHHNEGSAIEEWSLNYRESSDGPYHGAYKWTRYVVRWFPRLSCWRVLIRVEKTLKNGQIKEWRETIAEFPCAGLDMVAAKEEAMAFAESTWRLRDD